MTGDTRGLPILSTHCSASRHSLFRSAALAHPEHAASIARVLAIPPKRFDRALITYLSEAEVDAILAACDQTTWTGRRDHALLLLAVQTGLRISELTGLARTDVHLGTGAHVACHGKGRKDRITPLTSGTVTVLRNWLDSQHCDPKKPLLPTRRGFRHSRDAIEHRIAGPRKPHRLARSPLIMPTSPAQNPRPETEPAATSA